MMILILLGPALAGALIAIGLLAVDHVRLRNLSGTWPYPAPTLREHDEAWDEHMTGTLS